MSRPRSFAIMLEAGADRRSPLTSVVHRPFPSSSGGASPSFPRLAVRASHIRIGPNDWARAAGYPVRVVLGPTCFSADPLPAIGWLTGRDGRCRLSRFERDQESKTPTQKSRESPDFTEKKNSASRVRLIKLRATRPSFFLLRGPPCASLLLRVKILTCLPCFEPPAQSEGMCMFNGLTGASVPTLPGRSTPVDPPPNS